MDLDGRLYYALQSRPILDDARPPVGWASGLLVWGIGVPPNRKSTTVEDDTPVIRERWTHFGRSSAVKQLASWIEWRGRKIAEAARPPKSPKTKAVTPVSKPNSKLIQSTLKSITKKIYTPSVTPSRKQSFEVVIPVSAKKLAAASSSTLSSSLTTSSAAPGDESDGSSDMSDLSSPPETMEDLLDLLDPKGYTPSTLHIEEENKELARKLREVVEWLEVLEWKGMGEV
jgi:hypothetical protein